MKKYVAFLIIFAMILSGCSFSSEKDTATEETLSEMESNEKIEFTNMSDAGLLDYVESNVYQSVVDAIDTDKYFVENVSVRYISQEYTDTINYNSKENIYFGYKLSDIDKEFEGNRYVFSVDDKGKTIVTVFEEYDDTYDRIIENVAMGTGVILVCVTVSVISAGAGAPAVTMIFAGAAKTGTTFALSSAAIGGTISTAVSYSDNGNMEEALKEGALNASEEFKWGAIMGTLTGGASAAKALKGATLNGLKMNEAAKIQKDSGYPLDVIKGFNNMEQYNICKEAGLLKKTVNGKDALVRKIDLDFVDEMGRTNLARMKLGLAPLDSTGTSYELHHIGQEADSTLAILTKAEHMQSGNNKIWHKLGEETKVHGEGNKWDSQRQEFWKAFAEICEKKGV